MASETSKEESQPAITLEGDALKEAIKHQVEYYLSKHNLSGDAFLVSQMDDQMFVPISVIANFGKLKALTTDQDLLLDVLKTSEKVALDETATKIRPNFQSKRSTLILRDIPKDTPMDELKALFAGPKCPEVKEDHLRPDVLNTWFVTFDTEEDTLAALDHLRNGGVTFGGKPVRVGVKSESVLKSLFYQERSAVPHMYMDPSYGYVPGGRGWDGGRGRRNGARRGGGVGGMRAQDYGMPGARTKGAKNRAGRGKGRDGEPLPAPRPPGQGALLSPAHFPPLPTKGAEASGYADTFAKYTKEELLKVIQHATDTSLPPSLDSSCVVVMSVADLELEGEKETEGAPDRRVSCNFDEFIPKYQTDPPQHLEPTTEGQGNEEIGSPVKAKSPPADLETDGPAAAAPKAMSYAAMARGGGSPVKPSS